MLHLIGALQARLPKSSVPAVDRMIRIDHVFASSEKYCFPDVGVLEALCDIKKLFDG